MRRRQEKKEERKAAESDEATEKWVSLKTHLQTEMIR